MSDMTFNEYQEEAKKTAQYIHGFYPFASLMIEAAELSDIIAKPLLRGDAAKDGLINLIKSEAGDVLWNLSQILSDSGVTLQDVADYNIQKLRRRAEAGTIKGSGDR